MRFHELGIETRREMPARARSIGEGYLIRAGYFDAAGHLARLGTMAAARLQAALNSDAARWSLVGRSFKTSAGETAVEAATGDFAILHCAQCGYADALESARRQQPTPEPEAMLPLQRVSTPECSTIEALASFLGVPTAKTAKALMYVHPGEDQLVFVVIRGDTQASEAKLRAAAGQLVVASSEQIEAAGCVPGYASPIGIRAAQILVDDLIPLSPNLVAGANEHGFHLLNTNFGRDYKADAVTDLSLALAGDGCPTCGAALLAATTLVIADSSGFHAASALMCLADRHHDERGMQFPLGLGAFDVYLMHLPSGSGRTNATAADLHAALEAAGIPTLYDDRDARAGVKFNDADLIGCPVRITVGEKHLDDRMVELKTRASPNTEILPIDAVIGRVQSLAKTAYS